MGALSSTLLSLTVYLSPAMHLTRRALYIIVKATETIKKIKKIEPNPASKLSSMILSFE
jgi:hypothetical protein